jgi:hypothetical protein
MKWHLIVACMCIFLMNKILSSLKILISSFVFFGKMAVQTFIRFLLCCLSCNYSIVEVRYILWIKVLVKIYMMHIFSPNLCLDSSFYFPLACFTRNSVFNSIVLLIVLLFPKRTALPDNKISSCVFSFRFHRFCMCSCDRNKVHCFTYAAHYFIIIDVYFSTTLTLSQ